MDGETPCPLRDVPVLYLLLLTSLLLEQVTPYKMLDESICSILILMKDHGGRWLGSNRSTVAIVTTINNDRLVD